MLSLVKELCLLNGVSSGEDEVRAFIREKAAPYAETMRTDALGNLIVFKKGAKATGNKLMLTAHMDEVGFIVNDITEDGYLKFAPVGGIDPRVVIGKRVSVGLGRVQGAIGLKAYHLVSAEEEKNVPKFEDMYIDIGARDRADAEAAVALGALVSFESDAVEFGCGMFKAKAIDDRVGCAVMLKLLEEELPMDCTFVFSTQEEVGTRGAFGAAFSVTPEIALVLEGTTAADLPGTDSHRQVAVPGRGPVLSFMDGGTVYDRELFELMRELGEKHQIPWQLKSGISGGNDASAVQRTKEGVRVAAMSVAVRYLHAPSSVACVQDFDHMHALARKWIEAVACL
ncbi:M42 family metallopeptidase [Intestinimonas butyriciproducens]|uniref:M42 family metallopeptidase n=1 Tax=Intestinimonas butyriciproducens TaxID=1297617 RepID=UPI0034A25F70